MREIHVRLPDKEGRQLEQMAEAESRTFSAQVKVLIQQEWRDGGYADADDQKDNAA